jgi:hypothetical protein
MHWRSSRVPHLFLTVLIGCTFGDSSGNTGGGCSSSFAANGALQRVTFKSCRDTPSGERCEALGPEPRVAEGATFRLKASDDGSGLRVKTVSPEWFPSVASSFRAASTRSSAFLAVRELDTFVDDVFVDYVNVRGVVPEAIALFRAPANPDDFFFSAAMQVPSERELDVEEFAKADLYVGFLQQNAHIIGNASCQFAVANPEIATLEAANGATPLLAPGKIVGTTSLEITCMNLKTSALVVNRRGQLPRLDAGADASEDARAVDAAEDAGAP